MGYYDSILKEPIECRVISRQGRFLSLSAVKGGDVILIESALLYEERIEIGDVFTLRLMRGSVRAENEE